VVTKEPYQTRLDPDDARAVDDFAEDRGVTDAEALRRLVKDGLEAVDEDENEDEAERRLIRDGGLPDAAKDDVRVIVDSQVTRQVATVRRTVRLQTVATGAGLVYIAAVAGDFLGGRSAVAFGVLILAGLVAAFVFGGRR
jgi:hypothetical protein